eukprot:363669-Chlamydomonas_euryale.AAC.5
MTDAQRIDRLTDRVANLEQVQRPIKVGIYIYNSSWSDVNNYWATEFSKPVPRSQRHREKKTLLITGFTVRGVIAVIANQLLMAEAVKAAQLPLWMSAAADAVSLPPSKVNAAATVLLPCWIVTALA